MRDFIFGDYKDIVDKLTQENGREPERMEIALACYELGYTRAESIYRKYLDREKNKNKQLIKNL